MEPPFPLPPLRDFPDRAFRSLLEAPAELRGLLRVVAAEIADRIDYSRVVRLPVSFIQASMQEREADSVFRAPYLPRDGSPEREVWIYLLVEHQSDPDRWMPFRLLRSMVWLWEREDREQESRRVPAGDRRLSPILPVVFHTGLRPWERLGSLSDLVAAPGELEGFLPRFDSVFFTVRGSDPAALVARGDLFGRILLLFQMEEAPIEEVAEAVRRTFEALEAIAGAGEVRRWWQLTWVVVGYIRHRRPADEVDRLMAAVKGAIKDLSRIREVEVMAKTSADELLEKGRAEGVARGKAEGKAEGKTEGEAKGKRETLLRQLRRKFGALPQDVEQRIQALTDIPRLDELLDRILTAGSIEEMGV